MFIKTPMSVNDSGLLPKPVRNPMSICTNIWIAAINIAVFTIDFFIGKFNLGNPGIMNIERTNNPQSIEEKK